MKDNKGQALVEFVIIIPIFFIILFSAIDLGNVIYKKYALENNLDYIVDLYRNNKLVEINDYSNKEGINTTFEVSDEMVTIKVQKSIKINTPVLNRVLGSPYNITVDRVIYNE